MSLEATTTKFRMQKTIINTNKFITSYDTAKQTATLEIKQTNTFTDNECLLQSL